MFTTRPWTPTLVAVAVMIGIAYILFYTAPKSEDFSWTDGASFALNGALVHDYVVSGFHQSPMAFANEWFRRYPAVTISLYPPIFPVAEAVAFGLFGFSHAVAQATVAAFTGIAAFGGYRLLRTAMGPLEATGGVLFIFAAPSILLWSRQVMMELPSLAFLLLAAASLLHYQASRRTRDLILAAVWLLGAVYTKQTAIFAAPAFGIALVLSDGWRVVRNRRVLAAAAAGVLGLLPLAAFTVIAARETLDIALGQGLAAGAGGTSHGGAAGQAASYVLALPEVAGWPLLIAAVCYVVVIGVRGWRNPEEKRLALLMLAWFACGLAFVSATGHFEARYALPLTVPCAMSAALLIVRVFGRAGRPLAAMTAGTVLFAASVSSQGVARISGYDAVAAYVLDHSKQDDVVWFQGDESKNLAFSLRSHSPLPKVFMLRAEKFLVDYHFVRDWGISDRGWTKEQLYDLVDRIGITMVVLQPGFWADLPSMAGMQDYVRSDRFRLVAEFPITADRPGHAATIDIYVNNRPATTHPEH